MARPAALRLPPARPAATALARLALTELLLACDDFGACAQYAVDWLGAEARVRQALCAAVDRESSRLVSVAGYGVADDAMAALSVDLHDPNDPLVAALSAPEPVLLGAVRGARTAPPLRAPLVRLPCLAVPLGSRNDQEPALGLLLVGGDGRGVHRTAVWVADLLGKAGTRLGAPRMLAEGERRLRRERALLTTVIDAVPDPILLTDIEGRMVVSNARAQTLFAAGEDASEGRRRAVAFNNTFFAAALSGSTLGDPVSGRRELLLVDPTDGSDLLFELLSAVVEDQREGTRVVSILHDVTDLRRAMQEVEDNYRRLRVADADVRAERDRLNLIMDAAADPILVTDPAGNIELMNPPAERLFTVDPEASDPEAERRVQTNDAHLSSFVSSLYTSPRLPSRGELSLVDPPTGHALPVEAVVGQVLSERGEVVAVVTILHDRSEAVQRAALYEQLQRASDDLRVKVAEATGELAQQNEVLRRQAVALEQASRMKSQFLANMSHELRTPLNAILGYASMLLQGVYGQVTGAQERSLSRVDSNARHLLSIINDLLDIARIEAGKMPVSLETFAVADVLSEIVTEMEPIIARSRLAVSLAVAPDVPPVRSDRQKLKQIVMNLVSNALKFAPEGAARLSATYDPATDRVAVAVADTGVGIARKNFELVFEDFRQADDSPSRRYGGTGLGLSICRRLAAMLDGHVDLESVPGQGATFTLYLPRESRRTS